MADIKDYLGNAKPGQILRVELSSGNDIDGPLVRHDDEVVVVSTADSEREIGAGEIDRVLLVVTSDGPE